MVSLETPTIPEQLNLNENTWYGIGVISDLRCNGIDVFQKRNESVSRCKFNARRSYKRNGIDAFQNFDRNGACYGKSGAEAFSEHAAKNSVCDRTAGVCGWGGFKYVCCCIKFASFLKK